MGNFVKVTSTNEISAGGGKTCDVQGTPVAVFNVNGQFCAIHNTCLHRGGPLGEGDLEGSVVTCPWHGWQYDVTTGASLTSPNAKVKKFDCKVEGSDIFIEMD